MPVNPERVGLPTRMFLFTIDQVATMLAISESNLKTHHIFFENYDQGAKPPRRMLARNIGTDEAPDWRIAEGEVVRWMRLKGFRIYERGWAVE